MLVSSVEVNLYARSNNIVLALELLAGLTEFDVG
jgi:hypothetical protein